MSSSPGEGSGDRCLLVIIVTAICNAGPLGRPRSPESGPVPQNQVPDVPPKKAAWVHLERHVYRQCDLVHITGSGDGLGGSTKHPRTVLCEVHGL